MADLGASAGVQGPLGQSCGDHSMTPAERSRHSHGARNEDHVRLSADLPRRDPGARCGSGDDRVSERRSGLGGHGCSTWRSEPVWTPNVGPRRSASPTWPPARVHSTSSCYAATRDRSGTARRPRACTTSACGRTPSRPTSNGSCLPGGASSRPISPEDGFGSFAYVAPPSRVDRRARVSDRTITLRPLVRRRNARQRSRRTCERLTGERRVARAVGAGPKGPGRIG